MRAWTAGAGFALLVGVASCGGKGEQGGAANQPAVSKSNAPDHGQHGGAPSAAKEMPPTPAGQSLPGYAAVQVDDSRRQILGIRTVLVSRTQLKKTIRTVGLVSADETRASQVHVKFEGFIERIFVNYVGQEVQKGQPLFTIYSQDLLAAQHEYLSSKAALERIPEGKVNTQCYITKRHHRQVMPTPRWRSPTRCSCASCPAPPAPRTCCSATTSRSPAAASTWAASSGCWTRRPAPSPS